MMMINDKSGWESHLLQRENGLALSSMYVAPAIVFEFFVFLGRGGGKGKPRGNSQKKKRDTFTIQKGKNISNLKISINPPPTPPIFLTFRSFAKKKILRKSQRPSTNLPSRSGVLLEANPHPLDIPISHSGSYHSSFLRLGQKEKTKNAGEFKTPFLRNSSLPSLSHNCCCRIDDLGEKRRGKEKKNDGSVRPPKRKTRWFSSVN